MKKIIILFICLWSIQSINCQDQTKGPTWENISWMSGDWIGDGFGGTSYEHWSKPIAGIMIGTYRHVSDDKNNFFEFFTISENDDGGFIMKLRHFNPNMNAWEDKEGQLVWEFKGMTDDSITFGPCTYKKISDKKMEVLLKMKRGDKSEIETFHFERIE